MLDVAAKAFLLICFAAEAIVGLYIVSVLFRIMISDLGVKQRAYRDSRSAADRWRAVLLPALFLGGQRDTQRREGERPAAASDEVEDPLALYKKLAIAFGIFAAIVLLVFIVLLVLAKLVPGMVYFG